MNFDRMVLRSGISFFFKTSLIISTIISCVQSLNAQEMIVLNLNDCVDRALEYNYSIRQAKNNIMLSKSDNMAAFGAMLPQVSASSGNAWNTGLTVDPVTNIIDRVPLSSANGGLGFSAILFDGFQTLNTWRQAKVNVLITQYNFDNTRNTVALNTASQYLSVLMAKEALKVALEQLRVTEIGVSRLRKLNSAGAIPPNELLQMEAQLARDEQRKLTAENTLGLAKLILSQGIGIKINEFIVTDIPLYGINEQPAIIRVRPEAIFASSIDDQPNVKAAQLRIESAQFAVKAANASRLPRLTMNGQLATSYSDQAKNITSELRVLEFGYWLDGFGNNTPVYTQQNVPVSFDSKSFQSQVSENVRQYIGLNLSLPIFNGFQISNTIKRAQINKMNAELQYQQEVDNYEQTVERSHSDATSAWKQYLAAQKTVNAASKAFTDATIRRQEGTLTVYDYSTVQNTYLAAVSDALGAKYDAQFKAFILKFYMQSPLKDVTDNKKIKNE